MLEQFVCAFHKLMSPLMIFAVFVVVIVWVWKVADVQRRTVTNLTVAFLVVLQWNTTKVFVLWRLVCTAHRVESKLTVVVTAEHVTVLLEQLHVLGN